MALYAAARGDDDVVSKFTHEAWDKLRRDAAADGRHGRLHGQSLRLQPFGHQYVLFPRIRVTPVRRVVQHDVDACKPGQEADQDERVCSGLGGFTARAGTGAMAEYGQVQVRIGGQLGDGVEAREDEVYHEAGD